MTGPDMSIVDLLIVGAGPAGMAAAIEARALGLSVSVVDENPAPGGQIYRNAGQSPVEDHKVLGTDYHYGTDLVAEFRECGATLVSGGTVWMVDPAIEPPNFSVGVMRDGAAELLTARRVLIATGALERPFPIKGWTLPGVMTAGAAQTMLKASGVIPTGKVVLAGTGPLLYLLAAQFARASVPLAAVLETTPLGNWPKALPHLPGFLASSYFRKGLGLLAEVQRATRIVRGVTAIEAQGVDKVEAVTFAAGGGSETVAVDVLLLHQGVVPQVNLAMAAGCEHDWNEERLAFEPRLDQSFRSSVPGLFIAGDSGGIGGALAAETAGRLAALHIAADLGRAGASGIDAKTRSLRGGLDKALRGRRFVDALYRPADAFRLPENDVVVCRCEEVTAGAVRGAAVRGAQGPNQAKTFLRTGMGPCQGRLCGLTVTELMAREQGKSPGQVGHYHIRNPVKPITLGALAELKPQGQGETKRLF